jgi:4-diphosphocytidyl-2-C-methyl-D-erythritol kinase
MENGFHELDSLVVTVDLYDKVTLVKRNDNKVTLTVTGTNKDYVYNCIPQKDNAYRAVCAYMEKYNTTGADIYLQKNIPTSSGMGGSSTGAAAALCLMEEIYKMDADLVELANALGSDTNYLLKGGWARLRGRGDKVEYLPLKNQLELAVIYPEGGVDTTECFKLFDGSNENNFGASVSDLINGLSENEILYEHCKNALQPFAEELNSEVKRAVEFANSLSPKAVFMTGSGASVCMLFDYEGLARWAVDKCRRAGFEADLLCTCLPKN